MNIAQSTLVARSRLSGMPGAARGKIFRLDMEPLPHVPACFELTLRIFLADQLSRIDRCPPEPSAGQRYYSAEQSDKGEGQRQIDDDPLR